jgi:hypothetical protein
MKKYLLLSFALLINACIQETAQPITDDACVNTEAPCLYYGNLEVESCDGLKRCTSVNTCGVVHYCDTTPVDCYLPTCDPYTTQVDDCQGKENCYSITMCEDVIYCQVTPACVGFVLVENKTYGLTTEISQKSPAISAPAMIGGYYYDDDYQINKIDSCKESELSDIKCSKEEVETLHSCFEHVYQHPCFGEMVNYCRPVFEGECTLTELVCKSGETQVPYCYRDQDDCYTLDTCLGTIYCEFAPQACDPNQIIAPTPDSPNRIDSCTTEFLSDLPCEMNEIAQSTCFAYAQANDLCDIQYCRPIYDSNMDCAFLLECEAGDMEIDACYIGDDTCYTVTGCVGTVFCRKM